MNTKPSIFSFESSCQIRMFMIDGEPWFVTKDVCNALNIDVTQARKLDKKGWNKRGCIQYRPLVEYKNYPSFQNQVSTSLFCVAKRQ